MDTIKLIIVIGVLCLLFLLYVYKEVQKSSGKEQKIKDKKEEDNLAFIEKAKEASMASIQKIEMVESKEHRATLFQNTYLRKSGLPIANKEEKTSEKNEEDNPIEKKDSLIPETNENTPFEELKSAVLHNLNIIQSRRKELMATNIN